MEFDPGEVQSFEGEDGVVAVGVEVYTAASRSKSINSGTIGLTPLLPEAVIGLRMSKRAIHSCQLVCNNQN